MAVSNAMFILFGTLALFGLTLVQSYTVIDLTHIHNNESIRWGGTPDLEFTIDHRGEWGSLW